MDGLGLCNKGGYVESPPNNPSQVRDLDTGHRKETLSIFEDRALNPMFPSNRRTRPSATNSVSGNTRAQSNDPLSKNLKEDISAEKIIASQTVAEHSGNQPPFLGANPRAGGKSKYMLGLVLRSEV